MIGVAVTQSETGLSDFIQHVITPVFWPIYPIAFGLLILVIIFLLSQPDQLLARVHAYPTGHHFLLSVQGVDPTGLSALVLFFSLAGSGLLPGPLR